VRRDCRLYLDDILEAIAKIDRYSAGLSFEEFRDDDRTFDAVVRNLEIIGEASKNIPDPIRLRHPGVEWKRIAGLRDVVAHGYFGVDAEIVWDVVRSKLPHLREMIAAMAALEERDQA